MNVTKNIKLRPGQRMSVSLLCLVISIIPGIRRVSGKRVSAGLTTFAELLFGLSTVSEQSEQSVKTISIINTILKFYKCKYFPVSKNDLGDNFFLIIIQ